MPRPVRQARAVPRALALLAAGLLAACADTNAPAPAPEEVLLVVNTRGNSLSILPIDPVGPPKNVALGGVGSRPNGVAARGEIALVPLGSANAVAVVNLRERRLLDRIPLPAGSGATGVAVINDSIAYVGNPGLNSVSRVNYLDGTEVEVPVGIRPLGIIFVRGRVFVLNGNVDPSGVPLGASWITVLDPATNRPASGVDSIALAGPGGAAFATPAADGQFYVVSRGTPGLADSRLSAVDPLARVETASFAGLGTTPGDLISNGGARVFVSSLREGVLEFNTDSNDVVRGVGEGVEIASNSGVAVDSDRRLYAISAGDCTAGSGIAHVLNEDLEQIDSLPLGRCPGPARVVKVSQDVTGSDDGLLAGSRP
jgi:hypothetical protein